MYFSSTTRAPHRPRNPGATPILVIDEDREYGRTIGDILDREPYAVTLAPTRAQGLAEMQSSPHDLVILEAGENHSESLELARELNRLRPGVGLIFTSTASLPVMQMVSLYHVGADDFIEKPFHPMMFLVRIAAVARRLNDLRRNATALASATSALAIDVETSTARFDGRNLKLTATEFHLLWELSRLDGAVLPYEVLNTRLMGRPECRDAESIKSHISSLRRKLRAAGASDDAIHTERGVGYSMRLELVDAVAADRD